jgi:hypothetical protein
MHTHGPNGSPYDRDIFESFLDEVTQRQFETNPFGQPINNQYRDVPVYDQYNRGLSMTAQTNPRLQLGLDPREMNSPMAPERYVPEMPIIQQRVGNLGAPTEEMKLESMQRRGLFR